MLHRVKVEEYEKMRSIIEENIDRCGASDRTSSTYGLAQLTLTESQGLGGMWTDDIDNPTCYLVVSVVKMSIFDENAGIINCLYLSNEEDPDALRKVKQMINTAEAFFNHNGCQVSYGSSWIYEGREDKQNLWSKLGYQPQEILNVKLLKK